MAEAFLDKLFPNRCTALSAGSRPAGYVHPLAIAVMAEVDIDISEFRSKSIREFVPPHGEPPDVVISVCSAAETECPDFPGLVERLHWPFDDPADASGTDDEKIAVFRRVRDEIRSRINQHFGEPQE